MSVYEGEHTQTIELPDGTWLEATWYRWPSAWFGASDDARIAGMVESQLVHLRRVYHDPLLRYEMVWGFGDPRDPWELVRQLVEPPTLTWEGDYA